MPSLQAVEGGFNMCKFATKVRKKEETTLLLRLSKPLMLWAYWLKMGQRWWKLKVGLLNGVGEELEENKR